MNSISIQVVPASQALRCAVCHDHDVEELETCHCGSQFHGECGPCPTLGCVGVEPKKYRFEYLGHGICPGCERGTGEPMLEYCFECEMEHGDILEQRRRREPVWWERLVSSFGWERFRNAFLQTLTMVMSVMLPFLLAALGDDD